MLSTQYRAVKGNDRSLFGVQLDQILDHVFLTQPGSHSLIVEHP
jgi:hypothetical protein